MLLVADVGNTNTKIGIFDGRRLLVSWRLTSRREQTSDEYGLFIETLLRTRGIQPADLHGIAISNVVPPVRAKLFGAWEMNWLAYNEAHDVKLPGSSGAPVGFLMYPQAETGGNRLDSLDPDNFKYTLTAREIKA